MPKVSSQLLVHATLWFCLHLLCTIQFPNQFGITNSAVTLWLHHVWPMPNTEVFISFVLILSPFVAGKQRNLYYKNTVLSSFSPSLPYF